MVTANEVLNAIFSSDKINQYKRSHKWSEKHPEILRPFFKKKTVYYQDESWTFEVEGREFQAFAIDLEAKSKPRHSPNGPSSDLLYILMPTDENMDLEDYQFLQDLVGIMSYFNYWTIALPKPIPYSNLGNIVKEEFNVLYN